MSPSPPRPPWALLLLLLLLQQTGANMTLIKFQQMALATRAQTQCLEAEAPLPTGLATSVPYFCARQCVSRSSCSVFCHTESVCRLLNLMVVPGEFPPEGGGSSGSPSHTCFVLVQPSTSSGTDLARGKTVIDPGTWSDEYAPGYTVVRGVVCETAKTDCFCSSFEITPFLTVDLGSPRPVATVVVTVSSFFPDYFDDVNIHVGDRADETDALLTNYKGSAGKGEVLTLRGSNNLVGRYVSLISNGVSTRSLCLCLIQVYSV